MFHKHNWSEVEHHPTPKDQETTEMCACGNPNKNYNHHSKYCCCAVRHFEATSRGEEEVKRRLIEEVSKKRILTGKPKLLESFDGLSDEEAMERIFKVITTPKKDDI